MNWIDQCNNNFVSKKLQAFSLAASQTAKETQPNRVHVGVENLSKIWPEAVNITPCYAECCCQHYQAREGKGTNLESNISHRWMCVWHSGGGVRPCAGDQNAKKAPKGSLPSLGLGWDHRRGISWIIIIGFCS